MSSSFAVAMKALREAAGLSLGDLSRRIPWSKAAIGHAETGARQPSAQLAEALDNLLGANGLLIALAAAQRRPGPRVDVPAVLFERPEDPSGHIGASDVDRLAERTALIRPLAELLGKAEIPLYAREIERTEEVLRRTVHSEETRRALYGLLAEQTQLAAWAAWDAGRLDRASAMCARSREAAREAADDSLYANSFVLDSYQRAFNGVPDVKLAKASCDAITQRVSAQVRALIYDRAAFAFAAQGLIPETELALDRMAKELSVAESDLGPSWARWVGPQELNLMTGRCWAMLRRPLRAIGPLERELPHVPDEYASDKAIYLISLGEAYAVGGELELAAQAFARSSALAMGVSSKRPAKRLHYTLLSMAKTWAEISPLLA